MINSRIIYEHVAFHVAYPANTKKRSEIGMEIFIQKMLKKKKKNPSQLIFGMETKTPKKKTNYKNMHYKIFEIHLKFESKHSISMIKIMH